MRTWEDPPLGRNMDSWMHAPRYDNALAHERVDGPGPYIMCSSSHAQCIVDDLMND
jgi:hypothetical protein